MRVPTIEKLFFYAYLTYAKAVSEEDNSTRLAVLQNLIENVADETQKSEAQKFESENSFEDEVYKCLVKEFGDDNLFFKLKVSEFVIDICYMSENENKLKIAIECDGTKNHLSPEAYLHDIHKKKILEQNGYRYHQIYSTNWWANFESEQRKLIDFINLNK